MELTKENIESSIAKFLNKQVRPDDKLKELVQDSFLLVELVMVLQEDFSVRIMQEDLKDVETVTQLSDIFVSKK